MGDLLNMHEDRMIPSKFQSISASVYRSVLDYSVLSHLQHSHHKIEQNSAQRTFVGIGSLLPHIFLPSFKLFGVFFQVIF